MKRFVRLSFTVLSMLAAMLIAALITVRVDLHAGEVTIPDFSSLTVAEASDLALKNDLQLNIEDRFYSTTIPAGRILSQAPAAGSRVRKQWQVRVTESLGPQQVTIPDVTGETVRQAAMNLRTNQLDLGMLAHIDAPGDPEIVIAQTPPPDAGVDQPRVSLLLSSAGSGASSAFVLPSFVGMSYAQANQAAAALGLRTSVLGETTSTAAPATPSLPAGTHPGPNGTLLDAAGEPIARPSTSAATPPAAPAAVSTISSPAGPVLLQSPDSGYRANPGDTIRLTFAHVTLAAPPPAAPAPTTTNGLATPQGATQKPAPKPNFGIANAPPSPRPTH